MPKPSIFIISDKQILIRSTLYKFTDNQFIEERDLLNVSHSNNRWELSPKLYIPNEMLLVTYVPMERKLQLWDVTNKEPICLNSIVLSTPLSVEKEGFDYCRGMAEVNPLFVLDDGNSNIIYCSTINSTVGTMLFEGRKEFLKKYHAKAQVALKDAEIPLINTLSSLACDYLVTSAPESFQQDPETAKTQVKDFMAAESLSQLTGHLEKTSEILLQLQKQLEKSPEYATQLKNTLEKTANPTLARFDTTRINDMSFSIFNTLNQLATQYKKPEPIDVQPAKKTP